MNEKRTFKEQELLSKLTTQDPYSWQEYYRHYQNEDYSDAIQKIYIYVAGNSKGISLEELEQCINKVPGRFLKDPPDGDSFTSTNPSDWNYMPSSYGD
jgi:hypothetical protein